MMKARSGGKMQARGWCAAGAVLVPLLAACSGANADNGVRSGAGTGGVGTGSGSTVAGGAAGGSAAGGTASGSTASGGNVSGGTALDGCPEAAPLRHPDGARLELTFAPRLGGQPLVVGEPSVLPSGEVTPTNARLYISEVELLTAEDSAVPADLVTATGAPAPYGIQLVDWEEPSSSVVRLQAPSGSYAGARFTFGINDACNAGGTNRKAPLSANSQMVWPHVAGFLFFRYEALWSPRDSALPAPPSMIHMGGTIGSVFAPQATIPGPFTIPTSGAAALTVEVSFDEIFRGASMEGEVSGIPFPTPEVVAGEHLRRAVPNLGIFTLEGR